MLEYKTSASVKSSTFLAECMTEGAIFGRIWPKAKVRSDPTRDGRAFSSKVNKDVSI